MLRVDYSKTPYDLYEQLLELRRYEDSSSWRYSTDGLRKLGEGNSDVEREEVRNTLGFYQATLDRAIHDY